MGVKHMYFIAIQKVLILEAVRVYIKAKNKSYCKS